MSRLFTEIRWILQVALGVFLLMALVSYSRRDPSWTHAAQVDHIANWAGRVGAWTSGHSAAAVRPLRVLVDRAARPAHFRELQAHHPSGRTGRRRAARHWLADAFAFMLVLLACDGIEALRMWSLKVQLPRAPGGVIGEAVARGMSHALGFTGGTLALLIVLGHRLVAVFPFLVAVGVGESRRIDYHPAVTLARSCAARPGATASSAKPPAVQARRQGREGARAHRGTRAGRDRAAGRHAGRNPSASRENGRVPLFTDLPGDSTLPPHFAARCRARRAGNHFGRYARIHLASDRERSSRTSASR